MKNVRQKLKKVPIFVHALFSLLYPRSWGPFTEAFKHTKFDHSFSVSWSQGGEDLALLHILEQTSSRRYLDIGAHHPSRFSVTRHLYQLGWTGVNVDANPDAEIAFSKERPHDIFVHACVGTSQEYTFYIFDEPAISTNNILWREKFTKENQKLKATIEVRGMRLGEIISMHFKDGLDLLVVDAEGSDFDVLESGDWQNLSSNFWPTWIVCETTPPLKRVMESQHVKLLENLGYTIHLVLPMSTILRRCYTK